MCDITNVRTKRIQIYIYILYFKKKSMMMMMIIICAPSNTAPIKKTLAASIAVIHTLISDLLVLQL